MTRRWRWMAALWLLPLVAAANGRFALVIGNDEGASGRPKLWYASQDARRLASALTDLGDFPGDHVIVLENQNAAEVRKRLVAIEAAIVTAQNGGERGLLLFYFSGHANGNALELGADELRYEELRRLLLESPAHARVAIVDACGAGALTQVKGGHASTAINFAMPSAEVEGVAFLASTAVGEQAQESALLQGSFFTTHLEAALRGAGDYDGDGRVTLSEAFFYTSAHTAAETALTQAGPQHPTYDTHLTGRGDLVLADLRRADATLTLPPAPGSTWMVHGPAEFLAEVPGAAQEQRLALSAGLYTVERLDGEFAWGTTVTLVHGGAMVLPALSERRVAWGASKGGRGLSEVGVGVAFNSGVLRGDVGGFSGLVTIARAVGPVRLRLALDGAHQTLSGYASRGGVFDAVLNGAGVSGALLVPVTWTPARLELGAEAGADVFFQQGEGHGQVQYSLWGRWMGVLVLSVPLGAVRLGTEVAAGVQTIPLDGPISARFLATAGLLAGTEF